MAIATQWVANAVTVGTASTSIYTTAAATISSYLRDLVVTNAGAPTILVSFGGGSAATASSFQIPSGGSVVLTQCQVPNATTLYAITQTTVATGSISVGYATNVAYI